jgi:hypothetical protein
MKRYDPIHRFDQGGSTLGEMERRDDGDWVAFDEASGRLNHAETLLADLAESYWRTILNDQDPSGEGLMGERVAQYWARYSHVMFKWVKYCEQSSTTKP